MRLATQREYAEHVRGMWLIGVPIERCTRLMNVMTGTGGTLFGAAWKFANRRVRREVPATYTVWLCLSGWVNSGRNGR